MHQAGSNTHAFILRRYDTNAVSLTTMFKVAFPGATEEEEKREMEWVSVWHSSDQILTLLLRSGLRTTHVIQMEDALVRA